MSKNREPDSRYLRKYHWENRPPEEKTIKPVSLPIPFNRRPSEGVIVSVEWSKVVWVVKALLAMCHKQ